MQGQDSDNELFCIFGDCENVALYGRYCKQHIVNALTDAEARAAQLEQERDHQSDLVDAWIEQHDKMKLERDNALAERDRANAGFSALNKEYDKAMTRLAAHGEKVTA